MADTYRMSFTAADLMLQETLKLAEAFMEHGDWNTVRNLVLEENLLQARTRSSAIRRFSELSQRVQELSPEQLAYLVNGDADEQRQLLWFAVCKHYAFIRDFVVEVLREKRLALDFTLTDADFWSFFNHKADWHSELETLSASTRTKIREVLFRMLMQAGLMDKKRSLTPLILSEGLQQVLAPDAPLGILCTLMPLPDKD